MKISMPPSIRLCPQTLFVYGTYGTDGRADFGLFAWVSYYVDDGLGVITAICEDKLTRDNIRATGAFSMGLVTEPMLPLADYFGNKPGYDADKMSVDVDIEQGHALHVPVLAQCPWTFEIAVRKTIREHDVDIYLGKVANLLADETLFDESLPVEQHMDALRPVRNVGRTYFSWDGRPLGAWGEPMREATGKRA